jgi:hypothetical protein
MYLYLEFYFNELKISNVKSADFINKTYSRSMQTIYDCLDNYKQDCGFIFEDNTDQEMGHAKERMSNFNSHQMKQSITTHTHTHICM